MNIIISILKMLGGLALLIYGMKILSSNLKKISGGKLEKILINVTDNSFKGLLVGFIMTVATQSSAATTIIVLGLVNSGILQLRNAIPIIMGANIGTTMNSQILRLANVSGNSIIALFTPATFAPVILLIGLIIIEKAKNQKSKDIGQMLIGLGLLFTGMITMVNIASTFSELPILTTILQKLSNPILGVLAGTIITAIVQSSSATVGILQALSTTGKITYATTIPVILGQNIGTCVTSILASIGGSKNAKRVAAVHLYFNLIGTLLFLSVIYTYQRFVGFAFWNDIVDMGGIANFHLIFNLVSTIVLFPFIKQIEKLTILTVKDNKDNSDEDDENETEYLSILNTLDERIKKIPSIALTNSMNVIQEMGEISEKNFRRSMELMKEFDMKKLNRIEERENIIDRMEERVTKYLISLSSPDLSKEENVNITTLLKIESEFEKVGDYAYRFSKTVEHIHEENIKISDKAYDELSIVYQITEDTILKAIEVVKEKNSKLYIDIEALKDIAEIKRENYKSVHIERLKNGECNVESGIAFLEILTVCEKIMDHCFNVSIAISNYVTDENIITKHEYYKKIYEQNGDVLKNKLNEYSMKYEN